MNMTRDDLPVPGTCRCGAPLAWRPGRAYFFRVYPGTVWVSCGCGQPTGAETVRVAG